MRPSSLERVKYLQETDMGAVAISVGIFLALILSFLPLILSRKQWAAAQDRVRARRIADTSMNARLLRLNI